MSVFDTYWMTNGFGRMDADDLFTRKRKTIIDTKPVVLRAGGYFEKHLEDLFILNTGSNDDW